MAGGSDAGVVALAALHHLALPHLVFDPLERLVSLNKAAERLLPGLQSSVSAIADVFAIPAPAPDGPDHADGLQQGAASTPHNIRFLDALAERSPAWGAQEEAVLDVLPSTGAGGGTSTAVQKTVAVAVSRFIPPGTKAAPGRDHLYSVVLVRPVVDRQSRQDSPDAVGSRRGSASAAGAPFLRRAESDPSADNTPTLRSSTFADPFNKSSIARRRASEVAGVRAVRPPIPPTSSSSGSDSSQTIAQRRMSSVSNVSTVTASSEAPHLAHSAVVAANAAESPTSTRGSGSAGGSSSGQRSVGTGSAYSSASTAATTPPSSSRSASISKSAPPPPVPEVPEDYRGVGVSVSSAGIQLTHSVEARNGLSSPLRTTGPATTDWSPKLALANLDPDVTPIGSVGRPPQTSRPSSAARASSSLSVRGADDGVASSSSTSVADTFTTSTPAPPLPAPPPPPPPHSPRPTALPPVPEPKPRIKPDPASLLRFAALANLPHTGVIVSDPDLSSGYANALARELLMGVPSTDGLSKVDDSETGDERSAFEWWENGCWDASEEPWSSASAGTQGSSSTTSQPFFSPMSEMRNNPLDAREIIAAGNASAVERGKGTAGSGLRISKPSDSSRRRMNISGILARSLVSEEKRKAALGRDGAAGVSAEEQQHASRFSTAGGTSHLPDYGSSIPSGLTSPASTTSRSSSNVSRQTPQFVSAGGVSNRKSYRVFDATFSQRTIDPFGPMLEMVARKGEMPPSVGASDDEEDDDEFSSGGRVMNGMLVGVEIEVWSADTLDMDSPGAATAHTSSALKAASFVTANPFANRKKRVRRRVLEVTAAPLRAPAADGTMQHLGGILLLRDRTDERKREEAAQSSQRKRGKQNSPSYHKQILDNLPQMVWTTSPLGSHTYYNQTWYTYTGLEPEDSLGVGWQSPFHPGASDQTDRDRDMGN